MFSKFLSKVKSLLFKTSAPTETTLVNAKKSTNSAKKPKENQEKQILKKLFKL